MKPDQAVPAEVTTPELPTAEGIAKWCGVYESDERFSFVVAGLRTMLAALRGSPAPPDEPDSQQSAQGWLASQGWNDGSTENHRDFGWWIDKMNEYCLDELAKLRTPSPVPATPRPETWHDDDCRDGNCPHPDAIENPSRRESAVLQELEEASNEYAAVKVLRDYVAETIAAFAPESQPPLTFEDAKKHVAAMLDAETARASERPAEPAGVPQQPRRSWVDFQATGSTAQIIEWFMAYWWDGPEKERAIIWPTLLKIKESLAELESRTPPANWSLNHPDHVAWAFPEDHSIAFASPEDALKAKALYEELAERTPAPRLVTDQFLDDVEQEIGMGCGAWDMVPGKTVCEAVLKVAALAHTAQGEQQE